MDKIEIIASAGLQQLTVLEGKTLELKHPKIVNITGTINSPAQFLKQRKETLDVKKCHVIFSYIGMFVKLCIEETDFFGATVTGTTKLNPDLEKFGINNSKIFTIKELKQFLKMNRYFFADIDANMKMVTNLERFSASIQTQIDEHATDRGDKKKSLDVRVDSNLDLNFNLSIAVFVGEAKSKFQVEVCCDFRDNAVSVWLESAELQNLIITSREELINKAIAPFISEFVVIEQ